MVRTWGNLQHKAHRIWKQRWRSKDTWPPEDYDLSILCQSLDISLLPSSPWFCSTLKCENHWCKGNRKETHPRSGSLSLDNDHYLDHYHWPPRQQKGNKIDYVIFIIWNEEGYRFFRVDRHVHGTNFWKKATACCILFQGMVNNIMDNWGTGEMLCIL